MNHVRGRATLATVLVLLLSAAAAPVSARTFDVSASGSMILQPLAPGFACAMQGAMLNRDFACHQVGSPHRRSRAR